MNEIYVVGHRNPDTDSIVAAMSYAALRNALGDRDYVAAYLGHVSDETQRLLDRFGLQPPQLIQNVRTQVADLDYDTAASCPTRPRPYWRGRVFCGARWACSVCWGCWPSVWPHSCSWGSIIWSIS